MPGLLGEEATGTVLGFAESILLLLAMYIAGVVAFDVECVRLPGCRRLLLGRALRGSMWGLAFALVMAVVGLGLWSVSSQGGGVGPLLGAVYYAGAILLLFAVYDSVTMYLINGFTSLAIRGEAGPRVRARLLIEAATPFYWLTAGLALLLVRVGDLVLQPESSLVALGGAVVAGVVLYVVGRRAQDRWVWTLRFLEAVGRDSALVETLRSLMGMVRVKPWIALAIGALAVGLGVERSSYAYLAGALLYTVPVYRAVHLYVKYAFTPPRPGRGDTGGLEPEALEAARDLFYTTVTSTATASLAFTLAPLVAHSLLEGGTVLLLPAGYALGLLAYRRVYTVIRGLNVLAPVMVEMSRSIAGAIRKVVESSCSRSEECCSLARAGCLASTSLAPRLVEDACAGG